MRVICCKENMCTIAAVDRSTIVTVIIKHLLKDALMTAHDAF